MQDEQNAAGGIECVRSRYKDYLEYM